MLSLTIIFSILIIHWFADFILQTDKQAKGKSTSNKALLSHTLTYSSVWSIFLPIYFILFVNVNILEALLISVAFTIITFIFHTITDYFTSRLNSKLWAKGDVHNFFVSVGFDQVLHYVQLFLTYWILIN